MAEFKTDAKSVEEMKKVLAQRGFSSIASMDRDGDGNIGGKELQYALTIGEKILGALESPTGQLLTSKLGLKTGSDKEKGEAMIKVMSALDKAKVKSLDDIDANHDGNLSAEEINNVISKGAPINVEKPASAPASSASAPGTVTAKNGLDSADAAAPFNASATLPGMNGTGTTLPGLAWRSKPNHLV
jgi:hypothetical protein